MWFHHLLETVRSKLPGNRARENDAAPHADSSSADSAEAALGKARSLMQQCRRELAIQWYIRSFGLKRPGKDALYELLDIGCTADEIERIAATILTPPTGPSATGSPTLLWDVTPFWLAFCEGRPADREALWSFKCGQALARVMTLGFAVYDLNNGEIRALTEYAKASLASWSEDPAGDPPLLDKFELTHPIAATPTVLFGSPHWALPADRIGRILRPYLQKDLVLIPLMRNLDVWTWPEWFPRSRRTALRDVQKLYISNASLVFTDSDLGTANVSSVIKAVNLPGCPRVVPLPLSAAGSPSVVHAQESPGKALLVLTPHDPAELKSILAAYRVDPSARLVFIADDDSTEPDQTIARFVKDNPDMDVSEIPGAGPRVRLEMRLAASLLLPKSRSDAELWIGAAAEAGIGVFSMVGRSIQEYWSRTIDGFLNSSDPRNFAQRWSRPYSREGRIEIQAQVVKESVEELRRNMTEAAGQANPGRQLEFAHQGVFYCLRSMDQVVEEARIGSGIRFREGLGWGDPTENGTPIIGREGILKYRFWSVQRGLHRCMVLVASPRTTACKVNVQLALDGKTAATEARLCASELRWIRLEFDPGQEIYNDAELTIRTESDSLESEGDRSLLVIGWFSCPANDDACWFEFLERVSVGKLPVLTRRYRFSVIDSLRTLHRNAIDVPPTVPERRASAVSDRQ